MRPGLIALLIVTWLRGVAVAGPPASETDSHDRNGAVTAPEKSPWIDLAPASVLAGTPNEDDHDYRLASAAGLGGLYLGFSAWAYLAWYRNHPEKEHTQSVGDIAECLIHPSNVDLSCDGFFGKHTYAGGADKLGHAWATMVLARGGTQVLSAGGWDHKRSALVSAALAEGLFFAVEMKDYYYYEFSPGDFTFNTLGALTAVAMEMSPRLDQLFDFRVEYWPSKQYRYNLTNSDSPCAKREPGQPSCSRWNIAEDYSGETYLGALHLGAIHGLHAWQYGGLWTELVDVVVGFESRNYKPPPTLIGGPMLEMPIERHQSLFLGVTFNAQGLVDHLLPRPSRLRKVGHGVLEVITPPWTRIVPSHIDFERSTNSAAMDGA